MRALKFLLATSTVIAVISLSAATTLADALTAYIWSGSTFVGAADFTITGSSDDSLSGSQTLQGVAPVAGVTNTGVAISVTATSNSPGIPSFGELYDISATLTSNMTTSQTYSVEFVAGAFDEPSSPGLLVASTYNPGSGSSATATEIESSLINTTTIGSASFTGPSGGGVTDSIGILNPSSYDLYNRLILTAPAYSGSGKLATADGNIDTVVTPTPEPWNIITACATFFPVGLLYLGIRRRKFAKSAKT